MVVGRLAECETLVNLSRCFRIFYILHVELISKCSLKLSYTSVKSFLSLDSYSSNIFIFRVSVLLSCAQARSTQVLCHFKWH